MPFSFGDTALDAGASVQVSCIVSFGDLPLTISWSFYGVDSSKTTQTDVTTMKFGSRSSLLMIENINYEHNGQYTCTAKNSAGSVNYTTELIVNGKGYFRLLLLKCNALPTERCGFLLGEK
jgi:hypothetical protein